MDWYSWLSSSNLEPSLIYDYSLLFTHNELEEEDIIHFDHDFLLSMGVSIAKHRLEILKLAKRYKRSRRSLLPDMTSLLNAFSKSKKSIVRYFNGMVVGSRDRSAIVVVPKASGASGRPRWKGGMLKRNRRVVVIKQGRLMITDGGDEVKIKKQGASPMVCYGGGEEEEEEEEEMRWDCMFQNMKPT